MKLAKLSLVAVVVAGLSTSSFAADTLADAFKNGKVSGELRAWYFDRETDKLNAAGTAVVSNATKTGSLFSTGAILGYVTDSFYGFNVGAKFQSNYAPFANTEAKNTFAGDMYGSGAVLSEGYLKYSIGKTVATVGRQFISTPLVSGSGSRMFKESFEGSTIVNSDLPNTTIMAGYVDKFQGRTSSVLTSTVGEAPTFEKKGYFTNGGTAVFDGVYTAMVVNKSIPNLVLTGQYASVNDYSSLGDLSIYHAEANYKIPVNNFKLGFDAMYRASSADAVFDASKLNGNFMAARASIKELSGFNLSVAMGKSDSTDDLVGGLGNGSDIGYTGTIIAGAKPTYQANTTSYQAEAIYDFATLGVSGLKVGAQYAIWNQSALATKTLNRTSSLVDASKELDNKNDFKTFGINATYAFNGALKGLTTTVVYETTMAELGNKPSYDIQELRFMANYKF